MPHRYIRGIQDGSGEGGGGRGRRTCSQPPQALDPRPPCLCPPRRYRGNGPSSAGAFSPGAPAVCVGRTAESVSRMSLWNTGLAHSMHGISLLIPVVLTGFAVENDRMQYFLVHAMRARAVRRVFTLSRRAVSLSCASCRASIQLASATISRCSAWNRSSSHALQYTRCVRSSACDKNSKEQF
eukprot:COSAG05_NODE_1897_length_3873_cov_28.019873_4_plen_183_part_00